MRVDIVKCAPADGRGLGAPDRPLEQGMSYPPPKGVSNRGSLTHFASAKLSLDLDWNDQSPRMCVTFLPPPVKVKKSKGLTGAFGGLHVYIKNVTPTKFGGQWAAPQKVALEGLGGYT